ncbi:MAG: T9SS type A sorting domain-containing protein [Bacteroidota bacterium]
MKTILLTLGIVLFCGWQITCSQNVITGVARSESPDKQPSTVPGPYYITGVAAPEKPDSPAVSGPYFGQPAPGLTPVRFAASMMPAGAWGISFTPDGKECFVTQNTGGTNTLYTSREIQNSWTVFSVAPFSGVYMDMESFITPDGQRVYFGSMRPRSGCPGGQLYQWYAEKTDSGWSQPKPMDPPLYTESMMFPSVSGNKSMYYTSFDNLGQWISVSRYENGHYLPPEKLSDSINYTWAPAHPFIAQDESYLVFDVLTDSANGARDMYISFRKPGGSWTKAVNMGTMFNNATYSMCPYVSSDRKYFFFYKDLYIMWMDASYIDQIRPRFTEYLGETPPDTVPKPFAKDFIGVSPNTVYSITFSPGMKECYFSNCVSTTNRIWKTSMPGDRWLTPAKAPFPQSNWTIEPNFSPDGNKLFFVSDMPDIPPGPPNWPVLRIWSMERTALGWSDPSPLQGPFSSNAKMYPTVASNGNLYFTEILDSTHFVIAKSEFVNGQYQAPVILDTAINRQMIQAHPFIAPDESWLIFDAISGSGTTWYNFLYISYRNPDGSWKPAKKLDALINSGYSQYCGSVSPDQKYLFYAKEEKPGTTRLWWVRIDHLLHPSGLAEAVKDPLGAELYQNYPNPFSDITTISFTLRNPGRVKLVLNDISGQEAGVMIDAVLQEGKHTVRLPAPGLRAGVYTYSLYYENTIFTKKLIVF